MSREVIDAMSVEKTIVKGALMIGVLMLFIPMIPPHGALFGFLALSALGIACVWGYTIISDIIERERNKDDRTDVEKLQDKYAESENMTEEEFEEELEKVME